jgi:hypothetical protein
MLFWAFNIQGYGCGHVRSASAPPGSRGKQGVVWMVFDVLTGVRCRDRRPGSRRVR